MAESFVSEIAGKVLGTLGSLAYEEVCLALGVKNDIEKLADALTTIQIVLLDAERQQTHNPKLRHWLEKLKEVCYVAEDVLDDVEVVALQNKFLNSGSVTAKLHVMGHLIKEFVVKWSLNKIIQGLLSYQLGQQFHFS